MNKKKAKRKLYGVIGGTIAIALCCFTPVLVILLAAIGLSVFTPYLDYVLLPALAVMVVVTIYSFYKYKTGKCASCELQKEREDNIKDKKTKITCPKCGHVQVETIPTNNCQPFYKCNGCGEVISTPKDSKNCCVFCEYAEDKCPVPNVK